MANKAGREQLLKDAWIGDAVLSLYARQKILREDHRIDAAKMERLTSNRFLGALSEPSVTEAEIGKIYEREGLEAAFRWIEQRLTPIFERQEMKRVARKGTARAILE